MGLPAGDRPRTGPGRRDPRLRDPVFDPRENDRRVKARHRERLPRPDPAASGWERRWCCCPVVTVRQ